MGGSGSVAGRPRAPEAHGQALQQAVLQRRCRTAAWGILHCQCCKCESLNTPKHLIGLIQQLLVHSACHVDSACGAAAGQAAAPRAGQPACHAAATSQARQERCPGTQLQLLPALQPPPCSMPCMPAHPPSNTLTPCSLTSLHCHPPETRESPSTKRQSSPCLYSSCRFTSLGAAPLRGSWRRPGGAPPAGGQRQGAGGRSGGLSLRQAVAPGLAGLQTTMQAAGSILQTASPQGSAVSCGRQRC